MQRSGVAQPRGPCVSPASFSGPNYSPCFLFAYLVVFLKSDTPQELSRVRGLSELVARSALSVKISAAVCTFFGRVFSSRALFLRNHGSIEFFRKCSRKLSSLAGTWLGRVECSRSAPQPVTRCSGNAKGVHTALLPRLRTVFHGCSSLPRRRFSSLQGISEISFKPGANQWCPSPVFCPLPFFHCSLKFSPYFLKSFVDY